jgi:hypothetical protein
MSKKVIVAVVLFFSSLVIISIVVYKYSKSKKHGIVCGNKKCAQNEKCCDNVCCAKFYTFNQTDCRCSSECNSVCTLNGISNCCKDPYKVCGSEKGKCCTDSSEKECDEGVTINYPEPVKCTSDDTCKETEECCNGTCCSNALKTDNGETCTCIDPGSCPNYCSWNGKTICCDDDQKCCQGKCCSKNEDGTCDLDTCDP